VIDKLIDDLRLERHQWTPVRRVQIPKPRGKGTRPLGIPSWSDKLLQGKSILHASVKGERNPSPSLEEGRGVRRAAQERTSSSAVSASCVSWPDGPAGSA
jgi:hypothetical protein